MTASVPTETNVGWPLPAGEASPAVAESVVQTGSHPSPASAVPLPRPSQLAPSGQDKRVWYTINLAQGCTTSYL